MKKSLGLVIFIFLSITIKAQDNWESYLVKKEKGLMYVSVNMDLNLFKPNYKNLLIVGTNTKKCLKNGYPDAEGLEELYIFSDSVANIVDENTKNKLSGIITYQCAGFDVFYVKDTLNLRASINELIAKKFSQSKNYLVIERDKKWEYYKNTLYPINLYLSEGFFINQDLLRQLFEEGDDLIQPRNVTHWFYFRKENKRQKFIDKIRTLDFSIDSLNFRKEREFKYELQVSRKDSIHPYSISKLTKTLTGFATLLFGEYDGWSAELMTKD